MVSTDGHVPYKAHYQHSQEERTGYSDVWSKLDHIAETPLENLFPVIFFIVLINVFALIPYLIVCVFADTPIQSAPLQRVSVSECPLGGKSHFLSPLVLFFFFNFCFFFTHCASFCICSHFPEANPCSL